MKKLQTCPDEKRGDPELCARAHTLLGLPVLRYPGMSRTWLPAPTEPPGLPYLYPVFLLPLCGKSKCLFPSRLTSSPEFEVIKYCLWGCGPGNLLPNDVSTGGTSGLDTHSTPGGCEDQAYNSCVRFCNQTSKLTWQLQLPREREINIYYWFL